MRLTTLVPPAVVVAALGGCGREDDERDVHSVIASFYASLKAGMQRLPAAC